jgi:hypothetical protein
MLAVVGSLHWTRHAGLHRFLDLLFPLDDSGGLLHPNGLMNGRFSYGINHFQLPPFVPN